jgi:hypothetical protein
MGTTGDPVRPVTGPDRITLSPVRAGTGEPLHRLEPVPVRPVTGPDRITLSPVRAGTGEPLHRLEPVPVRVFTGTGSPVGRFSK